MLSRIVLSSAATMESPIPAKGPIIAAFTESMDSSETSFPFAFSSSSATVIPWINVQDCGSLLKNFIWLTSLSV